ncbi:MAG: ROK family transcriptional regulator [Candidatus Nanopelagicales bacterium]|nr:ROK family transcriptional regulator [Candidatus Nanopelagicales bacterium]MCF8538389.1 ROK family transcriptional regulator [Candidatus Nanopelagicales bacterium]MCF8542528.1 ROK family transcriptional regulator [Candidatus Nanopelagicales bacterium]MCF8557322.1 ROK family transcriptional regulator [Candidatus Nanopelagicales bacterium]
MPAPLTQRQVDILEVLRHSATPLSRSEIAAALNVARATLAEGLQELEASGLIAPSGPSVSTGGRPAHTFDINADAARIGIIDVGGSRTRVGVSDLRGELLQTALLDAPVDVGPERILGWACGQLTTMLTTLGPADTAADTGTNTAAGHQRTLIVIGLPGPIDFTTGEVVSPPLMSSWQGFDVRGYIAQQIDAPLIIDNDVNLIALAEQRLSHPTSKVMLVIKLGTGVGGGLVINGHALRGARGSAGDIGHTQATRAHGAPCRCGHTGCVEAIAGGWALVQDLDTRGVQATNITDVARLVRDGEPNAVGLVRAAAKVVGQSVAQAVSLLNPDTVVIAGELLAAGDSIIANIREGVYQYSLPLATRDLTLVPTTLGPLVGLKGGAQLGIDYLFGTIDIPQLAHEHE